MYYIMLSYSYNLSLSLYIYIYIYIYIYHRRFAHAKRVPRPTGSWSAVPGLYLWLALGSWPAVLAVPGSWSAVLFLASSSRTCLDSAVMESALPWRTRYPSS